MSKSTGHWYLYHVLDGTIVVDEAEHSDHHAQAHSAMGLKPPVYIAAQQQPMTKEQIEAYEKQYGMKFDVSKRKKLPDFEEPARWKGIRERNEKAKKLKQERMAKNVGVGKS